VDDVRPLELHKSSIRTLYKYYWQQLHHDNLSAVRLQNAVPLPAPYLAQEFVTTEEVRNEIQYFKQEYESTPGSYRH
jgi:hypothetical protein